MGDLIDFFSQSRFPKKPGVIHPHDEIEEARAAAVAFWEDVQKAAPKASCYQILGNHCIRPLKLTLERCPEVYPLVLKSWKELFKFDGVSTLFDTRDDLELDGVIYEHGFYGKPGQHLKENMKPTVIGHTHRPWIHYERIRKSLLWEMNVGLAADPTHEALSYGRKKYHKWVHGYGIIDGGIPIFVPTEG